jgi:hypothetical protein
MKLNPQTKKILVERISQKCLEIGASDHPASDHPYVSWQKRWMIWLDEMGIEVVVGGDDGYGHGNMKRPKSNRHWVYMDEPFFKGHFLRISRDLAEKIIILGTP